MPSLTVPWLSIRALGTVFKPRLPYIFVDGFNEFASVGAEGNISNENASGIRCLCMLRSCIEHILGL